MKKLIQLAALTTLLGMFACTNSNSNKVTDATQTLNDDTYINTFTTSTFNSLRWLEGYWQGSGGGYEAFFERYAFLNDTLLHIYYYTDSTGTQVSDSGSVYLSSGKVFHEAGGGIWRAEAIGSRSISFVPHRDVANSFRWDHISTNEWKATLQFPERPATVFELRRWQINR